MPASNHALASSSVFDGLTQLSLLSTLAQQGGGGGGGLGPLLIVGIVVLILVVIVLLFVVGQFASLYIQALTSNARVSIIELVGMRLRKVDPRTNVLSRIRAAMAGLDISTAQLEEHYLAGGRVPNVVSALIASRKARIELDWNTACSIDLAGRDIFDAVNTSVNPKVIDCPNPAQGRSTIDAVAKDGIQLKARARVTVRTNLARLVGGATEETVVARVGEGIVSSIGSAESHKAVLENPDNISKTVMNRGLDAGTAFEILSIDIADVDVGDNIGAALQEDQAEADKKRFQAEAEKRRAMAMAQEQEFRAEEQKNRALVVLAEAEVPKAMAEAFRQGNLGIMDYQKLRNIEADTQMRGSISGESDPSRRGSDNNG
ncbi:MAG: flotillin-like protein FloA [Planctomycetota bacterium]